MSRLRNPVAQVALLLTVFAFGCGDDSSASFDAAVDAQASRDAATPDAAPDATPPARLYTGGINGDLYELATDTGVATLAIDTSITIDNVSTDIGKVTSIATLKDGRVWVGTGGQSQGCARCLLELDLETGETTIVTIEAGTFPGLGVKDDGQVFTMEGDGQALYSVSSVGVKTEITSDIDPNISNYQGNSVTETTDGKLLIGSNGHLYVTESATGVSVDQGIYDFQGFVPAIDTTYHLVALATREDGSYWGILKRTGSGSVENSYLVNVTVAGAVITNVAQLDARYDGLFFR